MTDLRAFIAIDWDDQGSFNGPYDFDKTSDNDVTDRDWYYEVLDSAEGHSGEQVIELIKRDDGKWYPVGFTAEDREYAGAYRDLLRSGQIPEGRPGMPRDSMG